MMEIRLKSTYLKLLFVCLCLLTVLGPANGGTVVTVGEGSDAVLPCFISPKRDITGDLFEWKKDGQKKVFFYDAGKHHNNGLAGQDEQFKGRVSHFPEQLQFSNASIMINNTKLSDTGNYTCDFSPDEPNRQTFYIELVVGPTVVTVGEGSEARLPCLIRPERDITGDDFHWKKDRQNVFFYENGKHHNNGLTGQDEQFKGRVSHFPDQLQFSNASIVIRDTKLSDRGNYTCDYSPDEVNRQAFHIYLVVVPCPKPHIRLLNQTRDEAQLQCEVQGVSPNHKVEVKDSDGNVLTDEEEHVRESEGSHKIILNTTVTKTGNYRCVVTQEDVCHQVSEEIFVYIHGPCKKPSVTTLEATRSWEILQCEVQGVSQKTKVEWKDSSGNILTADETRVPKTEGIILKTTVTETGNYSCVVTQENICPQISEETAVYIPGPEPLKGSSTGWSGGAFSGGVVVGVVVGVVALLVVLYINRHRIKRFIKGPGPETERDQNGDPEASDKLGLPQSVVTDGDGDEREPTELDELTKSPVSSGNKKSEGDEEEKL